MQHKKPIHMVKKVLRIALFAFLGLLVVSIGLGFAFSDQLGQRVLAEVNKSLETELQVKDFGMELFSGFPNASLNFKKVTLKDTNKKNLLEADKIAFRFGLLSIWKKNIDVKSVSIQDAALVIQYDRKGRPNYNIFKKTSPKSSSPSLAIQKAVIKEVEVIYVNKKNKQESRGIIKSATLSGLFSATKFDMQTTARLETAFIDLGTDRFFAGADIALDGKTQIDLEKGQFRFEQFNFILDESNFDISGDIAHQKGVSDFDLTVRGRNGQLESIFQALPESIQAGFEGIQSSGNFYFDGDIEGRLSAKKKPTIRFDFGLKNAKLYGSKIPEAINDFSFEGRYDGVDKKSKIQFKKIKGYVSDRRFEGDILIKDLSNPYLILNFGGTIPVSIINKFAAKDQSITGKGDLIINELYLEGHTSKMMDPKRSHQVKTKGEIKVDDAGLVINDQAIVMDNGRFIFDNQNMTIDHIELEGFGHEVILEGSIKNYLPVLFADSTNSEKAKLSFDIDIQAKDLDIEKIVSTLVPEKEANKKKASEKSKKDLDFSFMEYLDGDFNANIQSFTYGDIKGTDFEGRVSFSGREMEIDGDAKGMGGFFSLEGKGYLKSEPSLTTYIVTEGVDIKTFFSQTNNFGQAFLTDKNINGDLDSKIILECRWDKKGHFLEDKLVANAYMNISDGELVNFSMMENFASFVKVEDLRHIKFTELENYLEIKDKKIYIPTMFIQSNAANLTVAGQHTFSQKINYNLKVNAGQILVSKFKKHDKKLIPQKARRNGFFNLFYTINGSTQDFKYRTDKKSVKRAFERGESRKYRLKKALAREFDFNDSPPTAYHPQDEDTEEYLPEVTPEKPITPAKKKVITPAKQVEEEEYLEFEEEL